MLIINFIYLPYRTLEGIVITNSTLEEISSLSNLESL